MVLTTTMLAQLVKNLPATQETQFDSWVGKIHWRRDRLPSPVFLGFPGGSAGKESLGWEDPLEDVMTTHPGILVAKSQTRLSNFHFHNVAQGNYELLLPFYRRGN